MTGLQVFSPLTFSSNYKSITAISTDICLQLSCCPNQWRSKGRKSESQREGGKSCILLCKLISTFVSVHACHSSFSFLKIITIFVLIYTGWERKDGSGYKSKAPGNYLIILTALIYILPCSKLRLSWFCGIAHKEWYWGWSKVCWKLLDAMFLNQLYTVPKYWLQWDLPDQPFDTNILYLWKYMTGYLKIICWIYLAQLLPKIWFFIVCWYILLKT